MKIYNLIIYGLIFIVLMSNCYADCQEPDIMEHRRCISKCETGLIMQASCADACNEIINNYTKCLETQQKELEAQDKGEGEAGISSKRGKISIKQPDGTWKEIPDKISLKDGDTIKTDRASTISLLLPDGSKVSIAQNSEFTFHWDGTSFSITLLVGKIRSWIKKYSHKFEVRTPSAVTSVRGTDFIVEYNPDTTVTTVYLYEGIVDVGNTKGETFELNAGEMITVDSSGKTVKSGLSEDDWNGIASSIEPEEELTPSRETIDSVEQKTGNVPYLIGAAIIVLVLGALLAKRKRN